MKQLDGSKAAMLTEVAIQDDETFKPEGGFVPETEGLQGQELYNIDEAVDICLRMATKNDLDEIFNLIQVVGKETVPYRIRQNSLWMNARKISKS